MGAGGGRAHFPAAGDRCFLPLFLAVDVGLCLNVVRPGAGQRGALLSAPVAGAPASTLCV
jgi:hypothetical protein